ncbi:hypothetical protein G5714_000021 [Onychostoma macrolepis]|uniref:SEA domain-containing protein n=2 Tax=Onychostoma macrolepis TaxID=369639 RepID=A0A7J6DFB7_9TELE|nr:hypothetical protein G5714_000021 [Onychostoma macrolepis]
MTLLRQQELAQVLLGYLKQRHASGSTCGSDTSSLSAWLEQSFGKFSIYVDYEDLRDLNTGFDSFEALDILSTSQVAQLTLHSGALNSAALINMVFERLEHGNSFQNIEEFFVTLTQTSQDLDINPVVRDIMMNRTFTIISLHFADFVTDDWVSWFTVKLNPLLPSLTAEMLQTATLNTACNEYHAIVGALSNVFEQMTLLRQQELAQVLLGYLKQRHASVGPDLDINPVVRDIMMNRTFTIISLHFADFVTDDWVSWFTVKLNPLLPSLTAEMLQTATLNTVCNEYHVIVGALSNVFEQMTLLRQQELAQVLLGYLKQRHASVGSTYGSDTSSLSAWLEESFGKFSIYVDYKDLREINTGFDSFEALDILSTSQVAQLTIESGALNSAALINMVFERLEHGNSFQNIEEFFVTLTQTSQDLDINPVVRDIMMNRTFTIISLHFADFVTDDWVSWFTVKLNPLLPSLTAEMLQTATLNTVCNEYHVIVGALSNVFEQMTLLRQQELAQVLLGYLKQRHASGRSSEGCDFFFFDLDINPVVRDIMMNRTFTIISLHFADFVTDDWVSWFTVKLNPLLPSLTAEMLQTATLNTACNEYHAIVGALSNVFEQMTLLRQQELAQVLLGYLKQRHASGRSSEGCDFFFAQLGSDTSSLSAWLEQSFGKFSIYVDYEDLREINTASTAVWALNSAALINMVFERLEHGNSFQNIEEFFVTLTQTSQDLDINPVVRDIMMNRTFTIISLHFADFVTDDWVSWFTVKLNPLLPSLTAEMLQTATLNTVCNEYHVIVGALSNVFEQMTLLRQQELAQVLLGYLKQRHASGSTCGSDTSSLSAWLEESFGKFSIYVDYKDLREINTGFDSVAQLTLESGALNSAALINMVFERLEHGNSFQNIEEFFVTLTQTSQDLDINPVVRDIMMNRTFTIISLHFADFVTDDWVSWFTVKLNPLLPSLTAEMLQTATLNTVCNEYHVISLSAWLEESFGKFSIYVDYKDLREINTGFDSFEALDILSTSQVAQLTIESGALNSAALINMVFERLEHGNSFQNIEEFFVTLTQTSQDLDINPVVRDIMMNRTFTIISLHFADFVTDDWVSWFTVKLNPLLPSLTAEMLQTATLNTVCNEYHVIVGALSSVFEQMTLLRQQELAQVLLGYLKQRHASVGPVRVVIFFCVLNLRSDTSSLSAWLEESFGKFSIYVDYKDLRDLNTGFDSVAQLTLESGALNSAALINMVFERLEHGNSFQNIEEFFVTLTQTSQDLDINPVVRDIMMNRTFTIISLHFADFVTDDWVSWFTVKLNPLLPSLTAEMLQTATLNTVCNEYHVIVGALSNVFEQMTLLRQQELAQVLLGYLKQRHASGRSSEGCDFFLCAQLGSDTSSLSAWLEESFGKFSIYVDYKDLREINTASTVAQLTLHSGALNSAALINMVFERLEHGNSFQNIEEFFVTLTQTSQDLDINPVVRDIMMNRTFTIISLHFADFVTDDWVSWFTVKLVPLLPSLTAEMLQTATLNTVCNEYHVISLSAWLEESFGKFSIYVDYKDLREINTGFDSVAQLTLESGALNSAALINMVFERLEHGNSFQNIEEFFVTLTQTSQDLDINPVVRDIMMNRTFTIISLHFADFVTDDWVSWFTVKLNPLLPSLTAEMLQTATLNTVCNEYHVISLSAWLEESFGKFSIYVDYKDLREINTGFDSVAQLTLESGALNSAALINMVFERLEHGNSFQNIEEFFVTLTQTSQDLDINPVVRDIMMNRTFTIISLHFADFVTDDWVSWFTVKLNPLLPSLTAEMLQTATLNTVCNEYHVIVGALSNVFEQMTLLRQQELAQVLLGYLKQRHASGSTCGSDTSSLSAWLEESFGKFSIYVDYKDLREINTGFDSFEALDILSTSQDLDINPVVRDIMMNRTFTIISLHFADFVTDDWVSWFTVKLNPLLPSLTAEMLQTATLNTVCNEYHVIVGALSNVFEQMTLLRQQELASVLVGYLKLSNETVNQDGLTTRQTQSSQNVLIMQTSSAATPVLSSVVPTITPTDLSNTAPPNYVSITVVPDPSTIIVPTDLSNTSVTTGPSVTAGPSNTTGDTHLSVTLSPNGPILSAVPTQKSSTTAPPRTLSTADLAHPSHTAPYGHSSTGDPTNHSNTTARTDPSITAVLTNQTSPTVGSSTTVHIEQTSTTFHTEALTTAVSTDLSNTTAPTGPITTDPSDSPNPSVPVGFTSASAPTDQSHSVVPPDSPTTKIHTHLSSTTLHSNVLSHALPTDRQSATIHTETSTTVVPADMSSTLSPTGFTSTAVTTGPSVTAGPSNTTGDTHLSVTLSPNGPILSAVPTQKSSTTAPPRTLSTADLAHPSHTAPYGHSSTGDPTNHSNTTARTDPSITAVLTNQTTPTVASSTTVHIERPRTTVHTGTLSTAVPTDHSNTTAHTDSSITAVLTNQTTPTDNCSYRTSNTADPTNHSNTTARTDPSITAVLTNQTSPTVGSSTTVHIEQTSTTFHTEALTTAVSTDLSNTTAPTGPITTDPSDSPNPSVPVGFTSASAPTDQSHSVVPPDSPTTKIHTHLSSTTLHSDVSSHALPTDRQSATIHTETSTTVVPADMSSTLSPTGFTSTAVTTGPSVTAGPSNTTGDTHLSVTLSPNGPILSAVPTQKSSTTAPPRTLSTADLAHPSHTAPYGHSSTGDPTNHSNTTARTDPSITAVLTNQTTPTVASSTTVHIERPRTTVHTGTLSTAVPTDHSNTTAHTDSSITAVLTNQTTPTVGSSTTVHIERPRTTVHTGTSNTAVPTDHSNTTAHTDSSITAVLTNQTSPTVGSSTTVHIEQTSTTFHTGALTTAVPTDLSNTTAPTGPITTDPSDSPNPSVPVGFTSASAPTDQSHSVVPPDSPTTKIPTHLSSTTLHSNVSSHALPTDRQSATIHTETSTTVVPADMSSTLSPTGFTSTAVTTGPSVTAGPSNTTGDTHLSVTLSPNGPILSAVPTQKSSTTAPPRTLSTADLAHPSHTAPYGHSSTGDPTNHSNTTARTDPQSLTTVHIERPRTTVHTGTLTTAVPTDHSNTTAHTDSSITAVLTNQTSPTVGSSTTVHIEQTSTTFHTGALTTAVPTDLSNTTAPTGPITTDPSDSPNPSVPVGFTSASAPTDQSHSVVPPDSPTTKIPTHLSSTTLHSNVLSHALPTDRQSATIHTETSTTVVPADMSSTLSPTGFTSTAVTTGPSVTAGPSNTTGDTHLSVTLSPNGPILSAVPTQKSSTTAPPRTLSTADLAHPSHTAPYGHSSTGDPTNHSNTTARTDPSITAVLTNQTTPTVASSTTVHIERPRTTVHTGTLTTAVPTDHSNTTAHTDSSITAVLTNQTTPTVGSSTTVHTERPSTTVHTGTSNTAVPTELSITPAPTASFITKGPTNQSADPPGPLSSEVPTGFTVTTVSSITADHTDPSSTAFPIGTTHPAVPTDQSSTTIPLGLSSSATLPSLLTTIAPTDLSNSTVPNDPSSISAHTEQLSMTIPIGPSTTPVPTNLSNTTVLPGSSSTVTTYPSSTIILPAKMNTTVSTYPSSKAISYHYPNTTISTKTPNTTAPVGHSNNAVHTVLSNTTISAGMSSSVHHTDVSNTTVQSGTTVSVSSAAGKHITTSVIFSNSTHSKVTSSTTSSLQTTHLSTKASTGSAVQGEGFVILQIRLQRQYIDAYNNPASMEYQILSINITIELNRIYREIYGTRFLRCFVIRFWPGSVGVDTELIFKNQTVLPNATSIAESLKTAIAESKVFLVVIPSSIIVVEQQDSTSTTRQTQTSQSVPIMQTSSAVAPALSSIFMLLLLLWNETL